jgi:hypothetical protein
LQQVAEGGAAGVSGGIAARLRNGLALQGKTPQPTFAVAFVWPFDFPIALGAIWIDGLHRPLKCANC